MNIASLDGFPAAFGNSMEMLRELVRSVVREELQKQRLGQSAPMLSSLADVIREKARQAVQEPQTNARTEVPLQRQQPSVSYADALLRGTPGRADVAATTPIQHPIPGGTLNSIRRGSQVEDEHRGVAQARGRHPGVDPVGRTARDETRAKDGRPVTGAGARPSSGGRDDGEAGTEPELHALSSSSSSVFAAQPLLPCPSSCVFVARAPRAPFFIGTARRAPHDADARSPSSYHTSPLFKMSEAARQGKGGYTHKA
ncbi:hypothetical protein HPB52_011472 [Rhipicephalus sanguineus]|uniref:Uncharacterized protein n=1 Tax=Rhipicephalus sanguineus TaxID=34632 RepID=A0A9D4SW63_RHISA|nr:hypothetical protein HPB52_011472 [Rhipicephalus sanguineus]